MSTSNQTEIITSYIEDLFDVLTRNFNQCKEEINMSSVHDCRVSLRRLMAMIDMISCLHLDKKKQLASDRKVLKKFQKLFSSTRDMHVSKKYISDHIAPLCDSKSYMEWLTSETITSEEALINELQKIKFSKYLKIKEDMNQIPLKKASEVSLTKTLFTTLNDAFLEAIEKIEKLDLNNMDTFHTVRISLKRFRYTLEILNLLDSSYKSSLDNLKQLQDYLGEIQDLTVLKSALMNCSTVLKNEFEYDCMLDFIDERLMFLANSFYSQRYEVLELWEIKI